MTDIHNILGINSLEASYWIELLKGSALKLTSQKGQEEGNRVDSTSKSQKKAIEHDITALMLPPPSQFIIQSALSSDTFRIEGAGNSRSEQSTALAGITSWVQSGGASIQDISLENNQTSLERLLVQYVTHPTSSNGNAHSLQQTFQTLGVHSTLLHGINPELVTKACAITEQQIVLQLLDSWAQAEQARAKKMAEQRQIDDVQAREEVFRLLQTYIENRVEESQILSQSVAAIFIGALVASVGATASIVPTTSIEAITLSTIQTIMSALHIPASIGVVLAPQLILISTGIITAAAGFATPIALTLGTKEINQQITRDAALAFARTLAAFLTNHSVDLFLRLSFKKNGLSEEAIDQAVSSIKTLLLTNTLALLYKLEYGGVSSKEIATAITSSPFQNGSLFSLYTKLINEELHKIAPGNRTVIIDGITAQYDRDETRFLEEPIDPLCALLSTITPFESKSHISHSVKA